MSHIVIQLALLTLCAASLASIGYLALCIRGVVNFRKPRQAPASVQFPVTVLKPICGPDANLYDNLRSFCDQDYPSYQVVFGIRDPDDPAGETIKRVIKDCPERDLALIIDPRGSGPNAKASNLSNMTRAAKHDILVVADSDMRVDRNYLSAVVAPFQDPDVGAVTCLYKGVPFGGLPSVLGAMFINEWFLPSVLVALMFQELRFCFGATMAVRRAALEAIGGFHALAAFLADDYMLGRLVSEQGYKVRLVPYVVENDVMERSVTSLCSHELRWARTVRTVRPVGFLFSVLTNALLLSALFGLATGLAPMGVALMAIALGVRILLHYIVRVALRVPGPASPVLVPVRDLLTFAIWAASFWGRSVQWRGRKFSVKPGGQLTADQSRRSS